MEQSIVKGVFIYHKNDKLYIQTTARLVSGLNVGYEPIFVLSMDCSLQTIGQTYRQAIEEFVLEAPNPNKLSDLLKPLIKLAKQRSWIGFVSHSKLVSSWLSIDKLEYVFLPTKNKLNKGYGHLNTIKFSIPSTSTDEEIGQAVLKALELCE